MKRMVKPDRLPPFVRALVAEAKRQDFTAYRLMRDKVMSASAATRFLAGDLNPTAATCEAIAQALGMTIELRQNEKRQGGTAR